MSLNFPVLRRYLVALLLQAYAILLALVQSLGGVRTDEAKYLLNIPYPHPPALRFVMGLTEAMPFQELFWRLLLATALVQAVWLVADLGRNLSVEKRVTLCLLWLTAGGIMLQAGTVMMAPVTALQALLFVWLLLGNERPATESQLGWMALLWLASLFTAYQAVLFAPIMWSVFRKNGLPVAQAIVAVVVPMGLMVLYIASNPLAALSFVHAGEVNAAVSADHIALQIVRAWLIGGSGILSIVGAYGVLRSKNFGLLASFVLVLVFLSVSFRDYYAVLFVPLLIGGVAAYPSVLRRFHLLLAAQIACALLVFAQTPLPVPGDTPAHRVMSLLRGVSGEGAVLIQGPFGHEWQYESTSQVLRYRSALLSSAKAVVCLTSCPEVAHYGFYQVQNIGEEVWVRK